MWPGGVRGGGGGIRTPKTPQVLLCWQQPLLAQSARCRRAAVRHNVHDRGEGGGRLNAESGEPSRLGTMMLTASRTYSERPGETRPGGGRSAHPLSGGRAPAGTPGCGRPGSPACAAGCQSPTVSGPGCRWKWRFWDAGGLSLPAPALPPALASCLPPPLACLPAAAPAHCLPFARPGLGRSTRIAGGLFGPPPSPGHPYAKAASVCSGTASGSAGTRRPLLGERSGRVPGVARTWLSQIARRATFYPLSCKKKKLKRKRITAESSFSSPSNLCAAVLFEKLLKDAERLKETGDHCITQK